MHARLSGRRGLRKTGTRRLAGALHRPACDALARSRRRPRRRPPSMTGACCNRTAERNGLSPACAYGAGGPGDDARR